MVPGEFEVGHDLSFFSNPFDCTGLGVAARLAGKSGQCVKDDQECTRSAGVLT